MNGSACCWTAARFSRTRSLSVSLRLANLRQRDAVLRDLLDLLQAIVASDEEVLRLIDREKLLGRGIGYIDAHLLAAARLMADTKLWTRDQNLNAVAAQLGCVAVLLTS